MHTWRPASSGGSFFGRVQGVNVDARAHGARRDDRERRTVAARASVARRGGGTPGNGLWFAIP